MSNLKQATALYPVMLDWKYGFVNEFGNLVVQPQYDLVGRFSEGFCVVEKLEERPELTGYINSQGTEVIPLKPVSVCLHFSEGLAQYGISDERVGFINHQGTSTIEPWFEHTVNGQTSLGFSEGISAVARNNRWFFCDKSGNIILEEGFRIAKRFQDNYALVCKADSEPIPENFFFINKEGEKLETIPCEISSRAPGFRNGLAVVRPFVETNSLDIWGFINTNGDLAFNQLFSYVSGFHEGICIVQKGNHKFGVINQEGEYILAPQFDGLGYFNYGLAPFKVGNLWGLINIQGEVILEPTYLFIGSFIGHLPFEDPFHNMEYRHLTLARSSPQIYVAGKSQDLYLNRSGDVVATFEIQRE